MTRRRRVRKRRRQTHFRKGWGGWAERSGEETRWDEQMGQHDIDTLPAPAYSHFFLSKPFDEIPKFPEDRLIDILLLCGSGIYGPKWDSDLLSQPLTHSNWSVLCISINFVNDRFLSSANDLCKLKSSRSTEAPSTSIANEPHHHKLNSQPWDDGERSSSSNNNWEIPSE